MVTIIIIIAIISMLHPSIRTDTFARNAAGERVGGNITKSNVAHMYLLLALAHKCTSPVMVPWKII